jgi:hypothetical protein
VGKDVATLPIGMWEELQMLQLYPHTCGNIFDKSYYMKTLQIGLWVKIWKMYTNSCGKVCRCYNSTHGPVGSDLETLPMSLWEAI